MTRETIDREQFDFYLINITATGPGHLQVYSLEFLLDNGQEMLRVDSNTSLLEIHHKISGRELRDDSMRHQLSQLSPHPARRQSPRHRRQSA